MRHQEPARPGLGDNPFEYGWDEINARDLKAVYRFHEFRCRKQDWIEHHGAPAHKIVMNVVVARRESQRQYRQISIRRRCRQIRILLQVPPQMFTMCRNHRLGAPCGA